MPLLNAIKVPPREPFHAVQFPGKSLGDLIDYHIPPAARLLFLGKEMAKLPVKRNQLRVDRTSRLYLGSLDFVLQGNDEVLIIWGLYAGG